jgi:hypothetical protein
MHLLSGGANGAFKVVSEPIYIDFLETQARLPMSQCPLFQIAKKLRGWEDIALVETESLQVGALIEEPKHRFQAQDVTAIEIDILNGIFACNLSVKGQETSFIQD